MITQVNDSYSSITADVQAIVANRCSVLDKYVLMQTGEREYSALIYDPVSKECKRLTIERTNNYSVWSVAEHTENDFSYVVNNEYYTYSNQGFGRALTLPCWEGMQTFSITFLCVVVSFAILFKGVLFRWLRK